MFFGYNRKYFYKVLTFRKKYVSMYTYVLTGGEADGQGQKGVWQFPSGSD